MIQRIQTLYLLGIVVLMATALFAPIATFTVAGHEFELTAFSLSGNGYEESTIWLGIIMSIATLLPLITIFLYRKRQLQVRLCGAEAVLIVGSIVFIALYYWLSSRFFEGVTVDHKQFGWAAPMPIVSLILIYLAGRAIFKDEILVRSLDRIR